MKLKDLSPQSAVGIVAALLGVAAAFGLPITKAQSQSVIELTGLLAGLLLVGGAAHTVAHSRRKPTSETEGPRIAVQLGRRKPKNAPALLASRFLTGIVPAHPVAVDHFRKLAFGLYGNDRYGDCGPTSVANLVRCVTGGLLGTEVVPSQTDVFDLYRRSGNPTFNPTTGEGDNGVDMQTMLEALLAGGIGDGKGGVVKPVAFAKLDEKNEAELEAAVAIFGGILEGVNLEQAQEAQTSLKPPRWDRKQSPEWGGHAVLCGAYETGAIEDVISWAIRVQTTKAFREGQLEEAWVVIWPWHLEHPAFQEGVDLAMLAADYKALTGRDLPLPSPTPTPAPAPTPSTGASEADKALWTAVSGWVSKPHGASTRPVAKALKEWAKSVGL